MTLTGTNTYVIRTSETDAVVVDPGPAIDAHVEAIEAAATTRNLTITAILVTHGHPDHYPAAAPLAARTGAKIWAHRNVPFPHDNVFDEDTNLTFADATFEAIESPGHTFDHLVFHLREERALFTGDVVLGHGTVVISPPGGAMRPYQNTLQRLLREQGDAKTIYGGHGEAVPDPRTKLIEYIEHRKQREQQILSELENGPVTIPDLVRSIYAETERRLWPAAARQILSYMLALEEEQRVIPRALNRDPTPEEAAIIEPNLHRIADPAAAELAKAELGLGHKVPLVEYRLA